MGQQTLDNSIGPNDWRAFIREFIDRLIEGVPLVVLRAPDVARDAVNEMPYRLIGDAAYHGVAPYVRQDLKGRNDLIGVPHETADEHDSQMQVVFKHYEQVELPEAFEWLKKSYAQAVALRASEKIKVERLVRAHPEWQLTVENFYGKVGVPIP